MVQLIKMNQMQYEIWSKRCLEEYILSKMKANSYSREQAEKVAHDTFAKLLPLGHESEDQFLYSIYIDDLKNRIIGYIWFFYSNKDQPNKAFIYDIIIEEEFRGNGYGREAMLACEKIAKKLGAKNLGLHVFGNNSTAIALYKSLGYQTTDISMIKELL